MAQYTLHLLTSTLISALLVASATTSPFTLNTSYFLSCGATANINLNSDNPSRAFEPDSYLLNSLSHSKVVAAVRENASSYSSEADALYDSARVFTRAFTYSFPLNSWGNHVLRLHFFAFSAAPYDLSAARFQVSALRRFVLLADFSVPAATSPVVNEYFLWVDEGQELEVTFTPIGDKSAFAFVNAIEVFTAPDNVNDFILSYHKDKGITVNQLNNQALEMVYRLNVGGGLVTPHNDTLWRTWSPDDKYLVSSGTSKMVDPGEVKYSSFTEQVAPQSVYDTARTTNVNVSNPVSNVTWNFPVDSSYIYLVRLHFCDFLSPAYENTIPFNIYVGDEKVENMKSSQHTDSLSEAFYIDFDVFAPSKGSLVVTIATNQTNGNGFLNGLEMFKMNNSFGNLNGTFRLDVQSSQSIGKKVLIAIIVAAIGVVIIIFSLVILCLVMCKKRRQSAKAEPKSQSPWSPYKVTENSVTNKSSNGSAQPSASSNQKFDLQIPLLDIKAATNDFDSSLIIGEGGFGKVYRGVLSDGTVVAVKRGTERSQQGYPAFKAEIDILSQVRHKNLVSMIGYCDEQGERILVYEFMEKGPLRNHLYGSPDKPCLSWTQRLQICIGAAKGLHYLHTGFTHSIIHRDVKSTNILLDENYTAKVADFGLSKQGPSYSQTHVTTFVKGTFGYMDPEYVKTQKLSEKSDVYSFGVMLFEVLCARPVIEQGVTDEQISLSEWALQWQKRGQLEKIIDQRLVGKINLNSLRKFGETGEKCLEQFADSRPTLGDVLWNLEYALQLQQTQLIKRPLDGSQVDDSQFSILTVTSVPLVRPGEFIMDEDREEEGANIGADIEIIRTHLGYSTNTASSVFSQLNVGQGR